MPVTRRNVVVRDADGFFDVTFGEQRLRIAFKAVDPSVYVRGVALAWEAIVIDMEGREFHGYGADRAMAFANVREAAIAGGTSDGTIWNVLRAGILFRREPR